MRTKLLGLHVDRLMEGLGLALDEVIDLKKVKAASVAGDDIHLQPTMKFNMTGTSIRSSQASRELRDPADSMSSCGISTS